MVYGKKIVILLGLLLVIFPVTGIVSFFPPLSSVPIGRVADPPTPLKTSTPSATTDLGPSIDITYAINDKIFHEHEAMRYDNGSWEQVNSAYPYSYMMADDGAYWQYGYTANSKTEYRCSFYLFFKVQSPYTDLKEVDYDFKGVNVCGGTIEGGSLTLYIANTTGTTSVAISAWNTDKTGTLTLGSSYVVDGYIHGYFLADCYDNDNLLETLGLQVDQLAFQYNDVTETRRSTYSLIGRDIRYTISWDTWDYNVDTTLTLPTSWTFQDVNPDCSESSNVFSCLVPKTYTALYTDTEQAIANWDVYYYTDFENNDTIDPYYGSSSYAYELQAHKYDIVLGGSTSLYTDAVGNSIGFFSEIQVLTAGTYWFIFSIYSVSSSGNLVFRTYNGASWDQNTLSLDTGKWKTYFYKGTISGQNGGDPRNWEWYTASANEFYLDSFYIYQSNVETGKTPTGTTHMIHPDGYEPMNNYTMEYKCSTWAATWTEYITGTDGTWSLSTSSWALAAGTETFETRNPYDTTNDVTSDSITYPWTDSSFTFDVLAFQVDAWSVHITVYTTPDSNITIIDLYEGVNTTKYEDQDEGSYSYKFEDWGDHTCYIECDYYGSQITVSYDYEARRDYPIEPLQGMPQTMTLQIAFTSLLAIFSVIGIAAVLLYFRSSRQQDFIVSLPEKQKQRKRGNFQIDPPHHTKLRKEHARRRK